MLGYLCSRTMALVLFTVTGYKINTQSKVTYALINVLNDDQKYRSKNFDPKSHKKMKRADKVNLIKVEAIIKRYNWPYNDKISNEGSRTIFLVLQHSMLDVQKKYFSRIKDAANAGKIKLSSLGMFEDRIAIQEGKPQIYGTQVAQDLETKSFFVLPIMNPETVDERRKSIGLIPIAEYLKFWNTDI